MSPAQVSTSAGPRHTQAQHPMATSTRTRSTSCLQTRSDGQSIINSTWGSPGRAPDKCVCSAANSSRRPWSTSATLAASSCLPPPYHRARGDQYHLSSGLFCLNISAQFLINVFVKFNKNPNAFNAISLCVPL